jgi:ribosome-associated translation inhibitor RaiA
MDRMDRSPPEVVVQEHGPVEATDREYAREKVSHASAYAPMPVLYARLDLVQHTDPAREQGAMAKAELDLGGQVVRARATAATMHEAADLLDARLRTRVERAVHLQQSRHRRHRDKSGEGSWRHGDMPHEQPHLFARPVDEREVVRRKSFAVGAQTPAEAAQDLQALDHDFFLFRNGATGEDNLLHRTEDGLALIEPTGAASSVDDVDGIEASPLRPARTTTDDALQLLDEAADPFVFFLDASTGRGSVVYRRLDGHYGLIEPSASEG